MFFSPDLESAFNRTGLRNSSRSLSGMCSMCEAGCAGGCEIGLSAVRGGDAVYPTTTGENQIASEKRYPIDFSHFNVNGRVFGALGAPRDSEEISVRSVDLSTTIGKLNPIKLEMPVILPAVIKLNWRDYFGGAAMAGVSAVVGEDAVKKDPDLKLENGKIVRCDMLPEFLDAFRRYYRGYGRIVLQINADDDRIGVPEYAVCKCGARALEFKFGQSAKGVQPVARIPTLEEALRKQALGIYVWPDPSDPEVREKYKAGRGANFRSYSRLPMWDGDYLVSRVEGLREKGLENVYFKAAGYDPADLERILRVAAAARADLVTFDGAGGGTGYSPCKMMNEWGLPAVVMEEYLTEICQRLEREGLEIPAIAVTGGFALEDSVYKALALGAPYVKLVGLCRAPMAAAMSAKKIGEAVEAGAPPAGLGRFGSSKDELFLELRELRELYGDAADGFSTGAVGVYSYLSRVAFGLRHFAALNRKFALKYVDRTDLIPLTRAANDLLLGNWMK